MYELTYEIFPKHGQRTLVIISSKPFTPDFFKPPALTRNQAIVGCLAVGLLLWAIS